MSRTRIVQTFTIPQQSALLAATGGRGRDYVLYTMALDTGLREHELVALNCGDVYQGDRGIRDTVQLRTYKRSNPDERQQVVALATPEVRAALRSYRAWKERHGQSVAPDAPLFVSAKRGTRLSTRGVRERFAYWLAAAGIPAELGLSFHALRHTACTAVQRSSGNQRVTQAFARHASLASTEIYMHVTVAEDVAQALAIARPSGRMPARRVTRR